MSEIMDETGIDKPSGDGPAYPHESDYTRDDDVPGKYTFKVNFHPGMTYRMWLVGKAMASMTQCSTDPADAAIVARCAIIQADATIKELGL